MTLASLSARLRKLEAARTRPDHAIRLLSGDELAEALREASDDPAERALADWFQAGCNGPLPPGAFDALQRSI